MTDEPKTQAGHVGRGVGTDTAPPPATGPHPSTLPGNWLWRKLRRVTSSGRYIPEVDGLRFVAIASVFAFHMRAYLGGKWSTPWVVPYQDDWLARLTLYGNAGVPLFFVISGFILGLPFASHRLAGAEPVSLRAYFARRLTRLEPPYLISLTAFFLLLRVVNKLPWRQLVPGYLRSVVYLHTLLGGDDDVINVVAWSLEVEVQFYALAPLLALVFAVGNPVARRLLMVALAYAMMLVQWFVLKDSPRLSLTLLGFLQYFLAGFLMADVFLVEFGGRTGARDGRSGARWDLAALAAAVAAVWVLPSPALDRFLTPVLFVVLTAAAFQGRAVRWALTLPWVAAIGGMCYSIYLIHYQLISLFGRVTRDLPFTRYFWVNLLTQTVVVGLPTLALSIVFFLLVEKPCMRRDWPARLLAWFRGLARGARARAGDVG